jgi:hypothetical protein
MEKKASKIDIAVLLIFFCRPEPLFTVFEQIKLARPSKLYLYQDGARENRPDDIENVMKCRDIVKEIDWECEVFYKYQEKNFGCDPSEFISQKWMFENEEYGIVLEDDDVPSQSFFPFCKEMLEKYKHDDRIGVICGMNNIGINKDSPYSYTFARTGSIWGWATWKRNVDLWEEDYEWLDDKYALRLLEKSIGKTDFKNLLKVSQKHKSTGKAYYETILGSSVLLNSKLNIIPSKNLISNIGIGANATHALDSIDKLPKRIRQVLFMKTYELDFPLKHPKYVLEDVEYKNKLDRIMGNGYPLVQFYRLVESIFYRALSGDFSSIKKGVKRRLNVK